MMAVSPSGYYTWRQRPISAREMANRQLMEQIKRVHAESYEIYGSPRIYRELKAQGVACGENRIARLMRLYGLRAKHTRRYRVTTKRKRAHPVAPNLLRRDFCADRPNQKWLADITYIPTAEGWLYLAAILDLYARRVVGWAMAERMNDDLVVKALKMAFHQRHLDGALLHHSDQGSQYTGHVYQTLLKNQGIQVSMNGVGNWYDNAPMESFFGTLKSEWVNHAVFATRTEARTALFFYIEAFYNRRRRHSALDYLSPDAFEKLYYRHCQFRLSPCPQN
jgi:transposase InsO family protein